MMDNLSFAQYCIETLVAMGVQHFCICPGSRSTPLTVACARHPKSKTFVFHDERSAAFAALGMGKTGVPAVLIITSGTAVANAYPAVIEASLSHIPLIILSGDRPPKLRDSGANQTIDQIKLFGNYTRFFFDLPTPSKEFTQQHLHSILRHAFEKSTGIDAGPIHLNAMFDEPFDMDISKHQNVSVAEILHLPHEIIPSKTSLDKLHHLCHHAKNPLIVIGEINSPTEQEALWKNIQNLDCPLLIDASSGLRLQPSKNTILGFEYLLRLDHLDAFFVPDLILHFGQGVSSKAYEQWLEKQPCHKILIHNHSNRYDPSSCFDASIQCHFAYCTFLESLKHSALNTIVSAWNDRFQKKLASLKYGEITVTASIPNLIPAKSNLFISNSMPIRNINNFVIPNQDLFSASNRGASGIDGLLSTAAGWCIATERPTTIVIGDLSTMHDFGVLFTLSKWIIPLTIVVINNRGGGIFSHLPIQKETDVFEEFFATAHEHELAPIVQKMGISTYQIANIDALEKCLKEAPSHVRFIEIQTDRNQNIEQHQQLKQTLNLMIKHSSPSETL